MRLRPLLVLLAIGALAPLFGQSSGPPKSKTETKPDAKGKTFAIGVYAGKVTDIDESEQTLKLKVFGTTAVPKFTPGNPTS